MAPAERLFNFSAGPAVLPVPVLEQIREEMLALPGVGMSVLEISHRSKPFLRIMEEAEARLRRLLAIPEDYSVLFLQGGSRLQFSMVPMNLLRGSGRGADYLLTGSWGKSAFAEAVKEGEVHVAWDGKAHNYDRLPHPEQLELDPRAAYLHFTSNETIQGVQFLEEPEVGDVPLVADCSSDFLCRPLPIARYGLIYACAQKNAGPAGVTVVIVRNDLLARGEENLPGYLRYATHAAEKSMWNTPPTFAVYVVGLVARWLEEEVGGLAAMWERNERKAGRLYEVLDSHPALYQGHAQPDCRSRMNVTFRLPNEELLAAFLAGAEQRGLDGLKGHRSVGGVRASIYNAMPEAGVEALREYMLEFAQQQGG